jgi:hypothetical protein
MPEPIVRDAAEAAELEFGAAIVLDPLREFLDAAGLGAGEIEASELGDGHSNLTFLLRRGDDRIVLAGRPAATSPAQPTTSSAKRRSSARWRTRRCRCPTCSAVARTPS